LLFIGAEGKEMETEEIEMSLAVGMRLGFRGAANALKGDSTLPLSRQNK